MRIRQDGESDSFTHPVGRGLFRKSDSASLTLCHASFWSRFRSFSALGLILSRYTIPPRRVVVKVSLAGFLPRDGCICGILEVL